MGPLLTKRYYRRWPTHPFTHKSFRPYALALGQLALAWNDLHESLAMLFCQIMGGGYVNQFLAVWHALKSDRSQRDILAASISSHLNLPDDERLKVKKEVEWICGQANTLEDKRNDALHSPLWSMDRGLPKPTVSPLVGLGHVRANKLLGKNLLKEFRWCRDGATVLRDYALQLDEALTRGEPLPNRPSLPNRGDSNEKKPPRQERKAKP